MCVSKFPSLYKDISHNGFRAHPNSVWAHLKLIISAWTLIPKMVSFTGSKGHEFSGDNIQSSQL